MVLIVELNGKNKKKIVFILNLSEIYVGEQPKFVLLC